MTPDDDELPPCIGERYRDTLHTLHRAARPPETEDPPMNAMTQTTESSEPTDLADLEVRCAVYRSRRDALRQLASAVNAAIEDIKREQLPGLRTALAGVADAEAALRAAVLQSDPSLWQRVRTRVFHGIKIGWAKARGKVVIDDEAKTIERIRKLLPADQVALLIRVREAVHKPAVYDLTAGDLRRLGIAVGDDSDQIVIRDMASELDRAIEALLTQIAETEPA